MTPAPANGESQLSLPLLDDIIKLFSLLFKNPLLRRLPALFGGSFPSSERKIPFEVVPEKPDQKGKGPNQKNPYNQEQELLEPVSPLFLHEAA